jgi:ABC-2 type transport system ATP-binding protein
MIEVDRLVKRFGAVTAVDGLSFTVRPGHVTVFLGPNGAGKTTTMRVILGLDAPTSGTATVNRHCSRPRGAAGSAGSPCWRPRAR